LGAICAHFGWSWHYLNHGIAWSVLQRIMSDLPSYESSSEKKDSEDNVKLTSENATDIMNYINSLSQ
jgi:hypothetical protein